jgi:7,8-dihydropterin-6-yl-methyl-4-(beta-D-ribofuranosyl)aminobenzene 5'-phosphate synthase
MQGELPLSVGGEDAFCDRWVQLPNGQREPLGVLDRRELAAANVRLIMADTPTVIEGQAFATGAIPRTGRGA